MLQCIAATVPGANPSVTSASPVHLSLTQAPILARGELLSRFPCFPDSIHHLRCRRATPHLPWPKHRRSRPGLAPRVLAAPVVVLPVALAVPGRPLVRVSARAAPLLLLRW